MKYRVTKCTAIAQCDHGDETKRQNALMVESTINGETAEYIVFGWEMPSCGSEFEIICEDASAWESRNEEHKTIITAAFYGRFWDSKEFRK